MLLGVVVVGVVVGCCLLFVDCCLLLVVCCLLLVVCWLFVVVFVVVVVVVVCLIRTNSLPYSIHAPKFEPSFARE